MQPPSPLAAACAKDGKGGGREGGGGDSHEVVTLRIDDRTPPVPPPASTRSVVTRTLSPTPPSSQPPPNTRPKVEGTAIIISSDSKNDEGDVDGAVTDRNPHPSKSKANRALMHVLQNVCEFGSGGGDGDDAMAAVRRVLNDPEGAILRVDDLCNVTDHQLIIRAVPRDDGTPCTTATTTTATTLQHLNLWRSRFYLDTGAHPTDNDWLNLTQEEFDRFRASSGGGAAPLAVVSAATAAAQAAEATAVAAPAAAAAAAARAGHRLAETEPQPQQPMVLLQENVRRLVLQLQRLVEALPAVPGIGWPSPLLLLLFPQLRGYHDTRYRTLARNFVESIGMSVLRNVVDLESGRPLDVVIRKVTRKFWQACIDRADTPHEQTRVCGVGTSGIGKTVCTPVLIKMLLERQTKVVYHVRTLRKFGWIYEFLPGYRGGGGASSVVTNVYPERTAWSSIPTMDDPSAYYVVDPGNSTDSCDPPCLFRPKVIIVASPDARHWGDRQFSKRRVNSYGTRTYFPLWELDELLDARSHLGPRMTEEQVKDRYARVGGIPSHVFADEIYVQFLLGRQRAALRHLVASSAPHELQRLAVEPHALAVFDETRPESLLAGYRVSDADDDGTFSKYAVRILNPRAVAQALASAARRRQAWPSMAASSSSSSGSDGPASHAGPSRRSPRLASKSPGSGGPRKVPKS
jgi:hypothetical protein